MKQPAQRNGNESRSDRSFKSDRTYPILGFAILLLLGLGCRPAEDARPAPTPRTERPAPRPARILGQIQLRGESDAGGIQIYIPGTSLLAITGGDGRFSLAGAPAGRHEVWARADGYQPVVLGEVDVAQAGPRDAYNLAPVTLDFQTQPDEAAAAGKPRAGDPALGSIRGQLVAAPGEESPEDWSGAAINLEKTPYRTLAGAGGDFLLWNLPADSYQMTVRMDGYLAASIAVRVLPGAQATTLTVPLASEAAAAGGAYIALRTYPAEAGGPGRRGGSAAAAAVTSSTTASVGVIRGVARYHRPDVADHSGISITLTGSSSSATTGEDGAYALEGVKPGRYQLLAQAAGYEPARVAVELAPGETLELEELLLEPHRDYPRVIQAIPASGARDVTVQREMPFFIRFSKKMNPAALRQAVRIEPEVAWQGFTGRDLPDTDFDVLKIVIYGARTPQARFDAPYRILINETAADFEGLNLQEAFALNFRTGRASIYRTDPADGANDIAMSPLTPVMVYFNAPIDRRTVRPEVVSITPRLETTPLVAMREAPDTGWTSLIVTAQWRPDTAYRITIGRDLRTIGNTPIANAPYHFRFRTARLTLPRPPTAPRAGR